MATDRDTRPEEIHALVADDDQAARFLLATLLRVTDGVSSVVEAVNGLDAVELGRSRRLDVALLDLNMPGLDGIEAALELRSLQPGLRIALRSSAPEVLRRRGAGLGLPLFDKVDLDGLLGWVQRQAGAGRMAAVPAAPCAASAAGGGR
ncbi:MAG TPA: response regulator transcription factor [Gaiellaceae bacterium]|jgi:CheY-like chemotaxis protein|nr:response regulator transcription factor [Gaiellaceae bacterium]